MKTTAKLIAFALAIGLATACTTSRNDSSAQGAGESEGDSVETVAPAADGMPTDGTNTYDSASQSTNPDSTLRR